MPIEDAKQKIDIARVDPNQFTSNRLGLGQANTAIPTDVEHFLNKQKGLNESSYTFGEAVTQALSIDNLAVSSVKSFLQPDFEIDYNYTLTKEQYNQIEKYPEHMRAAFLEAKSEDHFFDIQRQADERLEIERELDNMGWQGFSARMIAGITDPVAVGLAFASGGFAAPMVYGGKIARISRMARNGLIVGTENAIIESALVATDPLKNPDDIRYAMYAGFGLGGFAGAFTRTKFRDLDEAQYELTRIATKAQEDQQINELMELANKTGGDVDETIKRRRRLIQDDPKNKYNFTETSDSTALSPLDVENPEAVKKTFFQNVFDKIPRFSMFSSGIQSPDFEVRKFFELSMPDPVKGAGGDTMVEFKERIVRQVSYDFNKTRDIARGSFFKILPKGYSNIQREEMFNEIIADIIEFPERAKTYKYITPEMVQHANLGSRALDEILNVVAASGREGWSDISKARLTNYFPHTHSNVKVLQAIDEYGIDAVEKIYANALESIRPDIDESLFKRMIKGIVRRVSSQEYRGKENMFSRGFQGTDQAGMREFLEEIGLTNKQIDEVMSKFKKPDGNTLDPNARRRLPFDINIKTDVSSVKDGSVKSLGLRDLMDRNAERVISKYVNQVAGAAAMARFGNFKNNKELNNFLNKIRRRAATNPAYKNSEDHIEIMEVVSANLLGRQNPLEKTDAQSVKIRRILRMIGDYNFLRLFGQVGFAQGAELFGALGEVGWKTSLRTMPQLNDIMNRLKSGELNLDDPLLRELDAYGVTVGMDKFMNSPTARLEADGDMLMDDAGTMFNAAEVGFGKGKRAVADISFLNPMTMLSQIWGAKALSSKIAEQIIGVSKTAAKKNYHKSLKIGDQVRYKQLGWTENQFNNIARNITKHSKFENGYLKAMNLDSWDVSARSAYLVGINRWIDRVVQRTDLASMNKWFTKDFVKLLIQFRTFSLAAYEKQLLNGLYTLSETRGKDFETWSRFTSSMVGASTFAATQIYINSFGLRDRDEYLEEKLSAENLAKIGFLRSSWSTLIPAVAGTAYSFVSEDDLFGYGRNTELSSSLVSGIPSVDLIDNLFSGTRMMTKMVTDPDYQPSQSQLKKVLSIIALHNALGIKNVNNMIVDNFAK